MSQSLKCDEDCLPCLRDVKLCSLIVVATDGGQPRQSAQTVVKVGLLDTNDHDPTISFKVLPDQSQSYASVNENAKVGTSVAAITVSDEDRGVHGLTTLEIIEGNAQGHFELQPFGGTLYVLRVAARARLQRDRNYELVFRATDQGSPQRSSKAKLEIRVKEINEYEPKFPKSLYQVEISEAAMPGSSLLILQAEDQDVNADLTYELIDSASSNFKISPKSGLITVRNKLDRETQDVVQLKVTVSDGKHEATTDVKVVVLDVNDEVPDFELKHYDFEIEENYPVRQSFGKLRAIDRDLGENGRVTYEIVGAFKDTFEVNKLSGELSAKVNLDRDDKSEYVLKVVATDHGQEKQLHNEVFVKIHVKDVNDNVPSFYPLNYYMDMDSGNVELKAKDLDAADSTLSYELETNQIEFNLEDNILSINQRYSSLLRSDKSIRELKVLAIDSGNKEGPIMANVFMYPKNELNGEVFDPNERREYFGSDTFCVFSKK